MPVKKFKDPSQTKPSKLNGKHDGPLPSGASTKSLDEGNLKNSETPIPTLPSVSEVTPSKGKGNNKDFFKDKWGNITGKVLTWLDGIDEKTGQPRLNILLEKARLTEVATFAGIGTDKVLLLDGQPTQIIGEAESRKLQDLLPAIANEIKRRGTTIEVTERKAEI